MAVNDPNKQVLLSAHNNYNSDAPPPEGELQFSKEDVLKQCLANLFKALRAYGMENLKCQHKIDVSFNIGVLEQDHSKVVEFLPKLNKILKDQDAMYLSMSKPPIGEVKQ